jgi:FtsP/CotA-like multicopper oxidase with cupredoxin domain
VFPIPSAGGATDAAPKPLPNAANQLAVPGFFRMRSRFVDFYGAYVMHCHILAHEDRGMMAKVVVGPPFPPANALHHH